MHGSRGGLRRTVASGALCPGLRLPALVTAAAKALGEVFFPRITVRRHAAGEEPPGPTPRVEHDTRRERLSLRRQHDCVMFAQRPATRRRPVEFEARELQSVQSLDQVVRPVMAEAALLDPDVDEKIVELRGSGRPIDGREFLRDLVSANRRSSRFGAANFRRERGELFSQRGDR